MDKACVAARWHQVYQLAVAASEHKGIQPRTEADNRAISMTASVVCGSL